MIAGTAAIPLARASLETSGTAGLAAAIAGAHPVKGEKAASVKARARPMPIFRMPKISWGSWWAFAPLT